MDVWVKKIGKHRGAPRLFLDGVQAARAGFEGIELVVTQRLPSFQVRTVAVVVVQQERRLVRAEHGQYAALRVDDRQFHGNRFSGGV